MSEFLEKITMPYKNFALEAINDFNNGDYETALPKFLEMERVNFENLKVHEVLSYIYLYLDRFEDAEEQIKIFRELAAKDNPFIEEKPKTFDQLVEESGNKKDVEKEYKKIMRKRKNIDPVIDFDVSARLSVIYMSEGKYDKALDVLEQFKEKFYLDMQAS